MSVEKNTKQTFLWMRLSHEPFVVFYALLPFLLRKDLGAGLFELSVLSAIRPVLPVFSFYWGANLFQKKVCLKQNLIFAWVFARIPFLFVFWIQNVWYLIFCAACYELFNRAGTPALIEILKLNLSKTKRDQLYTVGFVLSFMESILLGLFLTRALSSSLFPWPSYCALATAISLSSIALQWKLLLPKIKKEPTLPQQSFSERLTLPWKHTYELLSENPAFATFQWKFMLGGFALMLASPGISIFYADTLSLSYKEITLGRSVLMGLGIITSAHLWKKLLSKERVDEMMSAILLGFCSYLLLLWCAQIHLGFFYLAYLIYGVTQSGSHLLWNLSGPLFSEEKESTPFSTTNLLMVGIRGLIAPFLGAWICAYTGPSFLLLLGASCILPALLQKIRRPLPKTSS